LVGCHGELLMSTRGPFHRSHEGERGATAILVALSLLMLMGFAAIAVDAGIAFSERRQQASAADVGALASLQFAKTTLGTPTECTGLSGEDLAACRGAFEALDVIEGTVPGRYVLADWTACNDPDDDALGYTQHSHISDCISFTSNLQRARVVLPGTDVETAFARPLGFELIGVGAFAEAGLELNIVGGVLPFAIGPSGAGLDQACFTAGDTSNLDTPPCGSGTEGNYGKLDLRLYGNENYATPTICTGSNAQRMRTNLTAGSDHPLEPASKSPGIVNDVGNCANITNPVDQVDTWTGNAAGAITDGLIFGASSPTLEGRLMCKGSPSTNTTNEDYPLGPYESSACATINTNHPEAYDHTPLWTYVDSGAPGTAPGGECAPGQTTSRQGMEECINWWKSSAPPKSDPSWQPLFTEDILESPRFAGIPILDADPGGGSGSYLITEFRPVYLETTYFKCNANSCDTVHSPGESSTGACPSPLTANDWSCGWAGNGNKAVEALSAFVLDLDMLPDSISSRFPYQDGTIVYNLYK
jgi:hypothetical protein